VPLAGPTNTALLVDTQNDILTVAANKGGLVANISALVGTTCAESMLVVRMQHSL
jgi:hypothetical protein